MLSDPSRCFETVLQKGKNDGKEVKSLGEMGKMKRTIIVVNIPYLALNTEFSMTAVRGYNVSDKIRRMFSAEEHCS
jgi:hypothetical protein